MILTVTPNPSLDRTVEVDALVRGEVHRVRAARTDAGGKGVNVARAVVAAAGEDAVAVLPSGGAVGALLADALAEQRVRAVPVPVAGEVRTNLTLVEAGGTTTKLNEPGPVLDAQEVRALLHAVEVEATRLRPRWVVVAGSLPGGAPVDLHAQVVAIAHAAGARAAVDAEGPPLAAALEAAPDLLKPNLEELAGLVARELHTVGDVVRAARELQRDPRTDVLVSLGEHGALLVAGRPEDGVSTWWAGGPPLVPRSTVGAGDCTLAGWTAAEGAAPERLARAVAWGRAAASLPGSRVPTPADVEPDVVVVRPSPDPDVSVKDL